MMREKDTHKKENDDSLHVNTTQSTLDLKGLHSKENFPPEASAKLFPTQLVA